jgi:hypothetical protein
VCWEQTPPELRTNASGSGLWPTPTASMGKRGWPVAATYDPNRNSRAVYERVRLEMGLFGPYPRPTILEWLMGWPVGWSALEPLEMGKFRQWLTLHGRP